MRTNQPRIIIRGDKKNKSESASLALQVFINNKRVVIALGVLCPLENWDAKSQRVVFIPKGSVNRDTVKQWNEKIIHYLSRTNKLLHEYLILGQQQSEERFRKDIKSDSGEASFLKFMKSQIESLAQVMAPGTIRHYNVTLNLLESINPDLRFGDLTPDFLMKFESHLRKKGAATNTIWRYHKDLRKFINDAKKSGLNIDNPYLHYKVSKGRGKRIWLTEAEVIQLRDLFLSHKLHPSYDKLLRYFLFSCFTGLRISDVKRITYNDIMEGQLVFIPQKTKRYQKLCKVPLNETAKHLIDIGPGKGLIFETFAEPVTNRLLKEVMAIAEIEKSISFHCARHTFAMLFLQKGGMVHVLRDILGHTDIETTMTYVHEMNSAAKEQVMWMD